MKQSEFEHMPPFVADEFAHASNKLEFGSLLEIIASYTVSPRAADAMLRTMMAGSIADVERSQREILEALVLAERGTDLPIAGWKDSWEDIASIEADGVVADGERLARVAAGERMAALMMSFLDKHEESFPHLSRFAGGFDLRNEVVVAIGGAIGKDHEVRDSASKELSRIRKRIGETRERLRREFASFAQKEGAGKGYEFVTLRGNRYVISMPRHEASQIKGIVHHASASGASLYVEPLLFVERNNMLESLIEEERREVERILRQLSSLVFANREALSGNQELLLDLDLVQAKASFARRFSCTLPVHGEDGRLLLRGGRHPLLEKRLEEEGGKAIRPLDLDCGAGLGALVISGPNAGGKTVALKTIGLLVLMDRTGLLVPCAEDSILPDYRNIFVDIGDDQSIENDLSTFSSRVLRLRMILERVDAKSLVLIDEIGDGTDPDEGAAIAETVLERLVGTGGLTIVTTHLRALKGWAHATYGVENATLEFDPEKLEPLFRLRIGVPGRSWGIEMAGRMGLGDDIVEQARQRMGGEALRLEELLAHLERAERAVVEEQLELEKKERELTELIESYRDNLDTLQQERADLEMKARTEALEIVSSTRREMEHLIKEIRVTQAEREVVREAQRQVREKRAEFEQAVQRRKRKRGELRICDIRNGDWYRITSLDLIGRALPVKEGSDKVFLELSGGLRVETSVDDLEQADAGPADSAPRRGHSWSVEPVDGPAATELMVRGFDRQEAVEMVDSR
jgi:DNA mismatch repair protein MutS2